MANVQVSASQVREEAVAMSQKALSQECAQAAIKAQVQQQKNTLNEMKGYDGLELARSCIYEEDADGNYVDTGKDMVTRYHLETEPSVDAMEAKFAEFENAYEDYQAALETFYAKIEDIKASADTIAQQLSEIEDAMGGKDDNGTSTGTDTQDPAGINPGGSPYGGSPYGGSPYGGNSYGGDSGGVQSPYSPPTQQTEKEEKDERDNTDYGNGDEGEETEPNVSQPITTTSPITTTTPATTTTTATTPASTQPTTTTNGTVQTPSATSTASTEQHVGGGYSGSSGFSYDSTQTETDEEQLEQQAASSIDNIISGRAAPKIPTSSVPIAKAQAARTTGSSVIPAASGLAAAAVIGLGAKAFLDKKKETEEEEEEEMFS